METNKQDFMVHYKNISSKLKKRFLRKPNLAEVSDQYTALGKQLQHLDCPHYAGMCSLAAAKCEQSTGNAAAEAQSLALGARQFFEAEASNHALLCPSLDEHLANALHCYSRAVDLYIELPEPALAAALCMEAAHKLRSIERSALAVSFLQRAVKLQKPCALDYADALQELASCQVELGDYSGALESLTEVYGIAQEKSMYNGIPMGVFASMLASAEVSRLLLLLLLQPPTQKMPAEHARLLDRYLYDSPQELSPSKPSYLSEDVFLLLRSLVMAFESKDREAVKTLQDHLWSQLTAEQNDLLHEAVDRLCN
ncbi:40-kDa huntingtin-associated protein isoform X2 [Ixodes scapularis]|uniref:40-kDa huntingtin-associated protein isoform X2 n=1 Tax=Ixodes scapularis TaxID=6945 RepID=UPI00116172A7|nr:40-kDa huntingtin-associated protein isoform X2 [Ixodes scapularis]